MKEVTLQEGEVFQATEPGIYKHGNSIFVAFGNPIIQYFFVESEYNELLEVFKKELHDERESQPNKDENVGKVSESFVLDVLRIALNKE